MKKENLQKTRKELEDTKGDMIVSFDKHLGNIETTKEELENFKEQLKEKNVPDEIQEREIGFYGIRKKLNTVIQEKSRYDSIDEAIEFLDSILKRHK